MTMTKMYIGGQWVDAQNEASRGIINPFDGQEFVRVVEGGRNDAHAAIQCARDAFDTGPWRGTTGSERADLLCALADKVISHRQELAALETRDTGKTLEESRWDMDDVAAVFRYYAELARVQAPESLDPPDSNATSVVVREPIGVCGLILPWNYPLLQASWKLAPALAAGCTVVMKPSELTPMTTLRLTELAHEVGFPPGVINTVLGPGNEVGAELAESHLVDLVSFTGGSQTGRVIMSAAGGNLKRVALELGGKNPNIVFADADLETALDYALNAVFFHAGQICSAGARLLVHDAVCDRFTADLAERIRAIKLGDGTEQGTQMGPLISQAQRTKVAHHVAVAQQEGAILTVGGSPPSDPTLQDGFFYLPTLLTGCTGDMQIVREEVFGPVISVERFTTEDEAVRRANDTVYGLSAGFWTQDPGRMERVSRALRFGTVWVNDFNVYFPQAPWGGYKQSGIGRELGPQGLDEYTELKHIYRNNAPRPLGWFGRSE
jgi:betaine-aldehyde dehydrogenase